MPCWYDGPLASFDTETTGIDVERDRVVSAALVVQETPRCAPRVTRWLVNPGVEIPEEATAVHGLTDEHLALHGRWPAPVMDEIARALADQAMMRRPLVVMNAPFDLTLLDRELKRHRATALDHYLGMNPLHILDPRVLDKHFDRYRKGRRTLADLCAHYEVELTGAHEAAADALAALGVVRALGWAFADRLEGVSAAELHRLQATWHAAQARGLQAFFTRNGTPEPVDPHWPVRPELPAAA
ncbi:exonuclease domain-containing protein [Streptomyces sp. MST-110588]|uniref:exonuclease domain-containing protein n=1 Tax=Streptomyces sp. MST-110588 TaxID=2833628 RepID=UPI001F5CF093|nr:exonuclease domain-containing protein [Streptomyces sp. MST-110588]UNO39028.1 3'-5' exonuclease [Streptomyces sp. MST-110588]